MRCWPILEIKRHKADIPSVADLYRETEGNYTSLRNFESTTLVQQVAQEFASKRKQCFGKRTHFDVP
jgi:hypothetical protein